MYHQLRKRGRRRGPQSFLPPSLVQNNCSHVLAFWQASCKEGHEGILRIFLCRLDDGLRMEKEVHSFPVNHTTVSFARAVHLVYRYLGGRLFSLSFIECIAAKLAYLELSNVFTLKRENTVWIVTHNEDTMTTDNKLMVGARFMLDDFVQCFPAMHAYTMVNQFSRFVGDYSVDSTKSDDVTTAGDYVSHIECRHERIEPLVGDQDFITPHRLNNVEGSFLCNVCSRGNSPLSLGNDKNIIHVCSLIREVCYASRSFLTHYNVDSGTDHDVSQQELLLTLDNVSSFFFYRLTKGGKDISVYREEAIRTLTNFMDNQLVKFDKDCPTSHHLRANELRKHLSCVDQPLKKVNNDKGEVRNQNHANALIILRERGFVQKYLRDYERLYDVDIVEVRHDPSSLHVLKCVDYARCPMPSQLTVPLDTLQKLDTYFKSNQRFKKDKLRRAIEVAILPQLDEDEAWERGWHVRVNAREFCQQLLSIQYRVRSGDRFDQCQRNELCLMNLYRLFDWDMYKEDIANVIKISVHERKLRNTTTTRYPLKSTLRLDQFFDCDEMTCIALLNLAVFNHVCKSEEEYCFVCVTPRPLRYPSQQQQCGDDGGGEKKKEPKKPSAQEINRLEDIVYRYGGESIILRTKEGTPVEVLQAYETLNKIHGASKQCSKAIFV